MTSKQFHAENRWNCWEFCLNLKEVRGFTDLVWKLLFVLTVLRKRWKIPRNVSCERLYLLRLYLGPFEVYTLKGLMKTDAQRWMFLDFLSGNFWRGQSRFFLTYSNIHSSKTSRSKSSSRILHYHPTHHEIFNPALSHCWKIQCECLKVWKYYSGLLPPNLQTLIATITDSLITVVSNQPGFLVEILFLLFLLGIL